MKKAIITGINGQDGSYLAELLLAKGYEVHGVVKRQYLENHTKLANIQHILDKITLHTTNLNDHLSIYKLISSIKPDECYHLAAASFVSYEFDDEISIISTNFHSTHFLLSSIKELAPNCKFYFAGSSEMFGQIESSPQNEETKFNPRSIYGISKLSSYYVVKNYRSLHGIYACTGITYNHESPRRGFAFVTKKITSGVAKIKAGLSDKLELGNIDAKRDWGYAPDYVLAMWKMLNNPHGAKDYVIATGTTHSVKDFLEIAFSIVDLDYKDYVQINKKFYRPSEVHCLVGDPSFIKKDLDWENSKSLKDIVKEMVDADLLTTSCIGI